MAKPSTAQNIADLVDIWEELACEPAELLFAKTFYHDVLLVADKVTDAIESNKSLDKWQKATIADLNTFIGAGGIEIAFMYVYYPAEIAQLQLKTASSTTVPYNAHDIRLAAENMIAEIRQPSYLANICQELTRICGTNLPDTKEHITALVRMFLVRAIELASAKMLEKHCANAISRSFLMIHKSEIATALQQTNVKEAFTELVEELSAGFQLFSRVMNSNGDRTPQERAVSLAQHLVENNQNTAGRIGLFFMRAMFDGVTVPQTMKQELFDAATQGAALQRSLIARYASDPFWLNLGEQWFNAFAAEAVLSLGQFYLEASLPYHSSPSTEDDWLRQYQQLSTRPRDAWKRYSGAFADSLIATGLFGDFDTELPPLFQSNGHATQPHSAKQALQRIPDHHLYFNLALELGATCSVPLPLPQKKRQVQQMIRVMVREMLDYLKQAIAAGIVDASRLARFDIATVLDVLATQRRIVSLLRQWLENIAEHFITSSRFIDPTKRTAFLAGDVATIEAAFHQQMERRVIDSMGGRYVPHVVDSIQPADLGQIITSLSDVFTSSQSQYRVTGIVDGLDLNGATIQIGAVRLYDSRVWDYGEAKNLDTYDPHAYRGSVERYAPMASSPLRQILGDSYEYKGFYGSPTNHFVRHGARAMVTVEAIDARMARDRAQIEMQQVLDTLTWSQTRRHGSGIGHKFELLPTFSVVTGTRQTFHILAEDDSPRLSLLTANGDEFTETAKSYHRLLQIPLSAQTPVEQALLRALHWLSRGYWETYLPDKFINYWIAVEQLLVQPGQSKLGGVQSRLPQLVATWFQSHEGQEVLAEWRTLLREIEQNLPLKQLIEADVTLVDRNLNAAVLLSNLTTVEQLDTTQTLSSTARLRLLMDKMKITAIQIAEQEKLRYKIELLNRMRNTIVHEGTSYRTDLKFYAGALWDVCDLAVIRVLGRVGAKPGHYLTVDDIITDYAIPF